MLLRLLCLAVLLVQCLGLKHNLLIENDARTLFAIESFGFLAKGSINLAAHNFKVSGGSTNNWKLGFMMIKTASEAELQEQLELAIEKGRCIVDSKGEHDVVMDMSDNQHWKKTELQHEVARGAEGLYTLVFYRCQPQSADREVSFRLYAEFYNPGPDYLSAGERALPIIYGAYAVAFFLAFLAWGYVCHTAKDPRRGASGTHAVHLLMAALVLIKSLTLTFLSVRYHYIQETGTAEAWSVVYYIFAFLKGILLFVVILLIGSGWSLMKPFLNEKEWKMIVAVGILQVLDNIALVILEETAPGSQSWETWRDVLHIVDIICCIAILWPILWSIRHLKEAATVDGKAQTNLSRIELFKSYYITVVVYLYFTRIVVYLMLATLPFHLLWLGAFFTETATLVFFVLIGYKFRPAAQQLYMLLRTEDDDGEEYGLDSTRGVELTEQTTSRSGRTVSV